MLHWESEVFDSVCKLIAALSPAARAEIRAHLADADAQPEDRLLIDPGAGPIHGNLVDP